MKHFLANENETGRTHTSSDFDDRLFREYYSVPFRMGFEEGGETEQTFFKGTGWVYAPLLGLTGTAQSKGATLLYREASQKSGVVKRVPGGDDVKVWGCRGTWFYVEYEKVKGWAAPKTLCSNPLTTCV